MSEYIGGPLDKLRRIFMKALRANNPGEKKRLIDEWNATVKHCNSVLMTKPEQTKEG